MKALSILLLCLSCAAALAQAHDFGPGHGMGLGRGGRSDEDWRERRERMQEFRQEFRQNLRDEHQARRGADVQAEEVPHGLRRLSPEARQRLRQEMREAYPR